MKKFYEIVILLLYCIVAVSCVQTQNQTQKPSNVKNSINATPIISKKIADYKSDTYKILLGDNYKTSDKFIDWRWAAENDKDGKLDSIGSNAFKYLGEPLLRYDSTEYLPTLDIETNGNFITSFSCSILFKLGERDKTGNEFLTLISKDIKQLRIDSIKKLVSSGCVYEISSKDYTESYTLTKGKELEYDKFEYTIKEVDKNGR